MTNHRFTNTALSDRALLIERLANRQFGPLIRLAWCKLYSEVTHIQVIEKGDLTATPAFVIIRVP